MTGLCRLIGTVLLSFAGVSLAQPAPLAEAFASRDADGFSHYRIGAGALLRHDSAFDYWGVAAAHLRYGQDGWSRTGQRLTALIRDQVAATGEGLVADVGASTVAGHTTAVGEATYNRRVGASTAIELLAARDWVDTRPAIEDGIVATFAAASVEQALGSRLTAIVLAGRQHFSDGNDRDHLRARLIVGLAPEHGLTLQLRHRRYRADDTGVPRRYFNPERYEESLLALALRRRVTTEAGGWMLMASAGAGRERIDRSVRNSTSLFELRADGPIGRAAHLRLFATHQRASGFESGPDYWYSQLGALLIVPLN